jgi:hypothetical protein
MNTNTIVPEDGSSPDCCAAQRQRAENAKPALKPSANKSAGKPKTERTNKRAEVIAIMKRARAMKSKATAVRAYLAEIGRKGAKPV